MVKIRSALYPSAFLLHARAQGRRGTSTEIHTSRSERTSKPAVSNSKCPSRGNHTIHVRCFCRYIRREPGGRGLESTGEGEKINYKRWVTPATTSTLLMATEALVHTAMAAHTVATTGVGLHPACLMDQPFGRLTPTPIKVHRKPISPNRAVFCVQSSVVYAHV